MAVFHAMSAFWGKAGGSLIAIDTRLDPSAHYGHCRQTIRPDTVMQHLAGEAVDPPRVAQILTEWVVPLLLWQFLQRCIDRPGIHDYFWESLQNKG